MNMRCIKCDNELILGKNWRENSKQCSKYICNKCDSKITMDRRKTHQEEYRETLRRTSKERRVKLKLEIYKLLGDKCVNPYNLNHGEFISDIRCLQIDHVNGNGCNCKQTKGNEMYLKEILNEIKAGSKDYQLLCANCNWIKRFENKEIRQKLPIKEMSYVNLWKKRKYGKNDG